MSATVYLVVEMPAPSAIEAAKLRGIRAVIGDPRATHTVLVASMDDYEKVRDWFVQGGLRRTFGPGGK